MLLHAARQLRLLRVILARRLGRRWTDATSSERAHKADGQSRSWLFEQGICVLKFWRHRGLRAEAIHLPLVPRPSLNSRREVHNLMISKEASKSRKSASSQ